MALAEQFEAAVVQHMPYMRRMAHRYLKNPADAEDVVQDAMLKAYRGLSAFEGRANLKTWMQSIVINEALMKLRKSSKMSLVSVDDLQNIVLGKDNPEMILQQQELRQRMESLIAGLPESMQATIRLRCFGLSVLEIVEFLEVPEGTVKARLMRAKVMMRQQISKQEKIAWPKWIGYRKGEACATR